MATYHQPESHPSPVKVDSVLTKRIEGPANDLVDFFGEYPLMEALKAIGWGPGSEVAILVAIAANHEADPNAALKALEALRKRQIDAARFSGKLAQLTVTAEQTQDGEVKKKVTAEILSVAKEATQRTLSLLGKATKGLTNAPVQEFQSKIIDVEALPVGSGDPSHGPDGPLGGEAERPSADYRPGVAPDDD